MIESGVVWGMITVSLVSTCRGGVCVSGGYSEFIVGEGFACAVFLLLFECFPIFMNLCYIAQSVFVVFYCGGRNHDLSDE